MVCPSCVTIVPIQDETLEQIKASTWLFTKNIVIGRRNGAKNRQFGRTLSWKLRYCPNKCWEVEKRVGVMRAAIKWLVYRRCINN